MTYTEIAEEYDRALEEHQRLRVIHKQISLRMERAEVILNELRMYLEDPTSYRIQNENER